MLSFVPFILVLNFFGPSSALQDNDSTICKLTDAPNQCGAFCLAALHPLMDNDHKNQMKLNRIEQGMEFLKNVSEGQLGAVNSEIKNQLQLLLSKLKDQDAQLLEVKEKLLALENQQSAFQSTLLGTHSAIYHRTIYPKFERIGSRYFYFEHDIKKTWDEAAEGCRGMGGHLAAFESEGELAAIMPKLNSCCSYWTGINDSKDDGHFMSTASGKPAAALNWIVGEPDNSGACVQLNGGWGMGDYRCNDKRYFICQSDNET
ncbi:hypothetical protein KR084_012455 [Drosophila pseudotakahashii]|nr:hypothetical protein KR084_012455 [Drosophila pseudotakahashii]